MMKSIFRKNDEIKSIFTMDYVFFLSILRTTDVIKSILRLNDVINSIIR